MPGYDTGGGGGRSQSDAVNSRIVLTKPYDIPTGEWTPETAHNLNEMLIQLYDYLGRTEDRVDEVEDNAGGTGDVVGPSSATSGNIATFDGSTGKLIQDGGTISSILSAAGELVVGFVDLTAAQVQSLSTSPVTLIAAQGAGKVIQLVKIMSVCDVAVAFNATQTGTVRYIAPTSITLASLSLVANTATGKRISNPAMTGGTANGTDPANQGIEIIGSTAPTTGSFNGTGCRITFSYYVEDVPY